MKKHHFVSRFFASKKNRKAGFTLIEILVVIGIIALLATIVIVAINPARQFAQARNTQRTSNVNTILNAVGQRIADNKGLFTSATCATDIPTVAASTSALFIAAPASATAVDLRACLVPTYIPEFPIDPAIGVAYDSVANTYDTKYKIYRDSATGRITVFATYLEPTLGNIEISVTR